MTKIVRIVVAVMVGGMLIFASPFVYLGFKSANQRRALQNRTDFPQIASACIALARSITNHTPFLKPTDPSVPSLLRSLSPKYISVDSNYVTMEFHGGFDHYGYRVRQSEADPKEWTIFWYTEKGEQALTTISDD